MTAITTIIPVRNGAKFITDALASLSRQIILPDEILVVDDGSTDNTVEVVLAASNSNPAIKLLKGPQKGPGPARNVAMEQASGDIITFLDADDLWPADKLHVQLQRLNKEPRVDVVSGFIRYFDKLSRQKLAPADDSRINDIFHVHLGAAVFRRSVFEKLGHFHEDLLYSEDVDLLLKIREADIPMAILKHVTLYYRRHENAMTTTVTPEESKSFNTAIFRSIMRRRAAGINNPLPPFSSLMEDYK